MRLNKQLKEKNQESLASVLPITAIVLVLSITVAPLPPGALVLFCSARCFWWPEWASSPWGRTCL